MSKVIDHLFHYRTAYLTIICIPAFFYVGWDGLLMTLLLWSVFFGPVIVCGFHDYLCHNWFVPKNRIIKFILLYLIIVYLLSNIKNKYAYHVKHHMHTGDHNKDPTQIKLDATSTWRFFFDLYSPKNLFLTDGIKTPQDTDWELVDSLIPYIRIITVLLLTLLAIVNLKLFFILYLFQVWLWITIPKWVDIEFHKYFSEDKPYMAPIMFHAAWHKTHHKDWRTVNHGTGAWSYLNFSKIYRRLLFKDNTLNV